MVRNQARYRENVRLEGAKGVVSGHTYSSAAAENVMNRLFDAVDVRNAGDVNFCEFASALSVSWRDPETCIKINIDGRPYVVRQNEYDRNMSAACHS